MNIIHIRICSGKKIICYTPNSPDIEKKQSKEEFFLQISNLISCIESYKKSFDNISTIFRRVGSSKLGFDYFQIFKYIWIFKYICEYFLRIIFLFIFGVQGVENNIHIRIRMICLLRIIFLFVFVHQKNYSLNSAKVALI